MSESYATERKHVVVIFNRPQSLPLPQKKERKLLVPTEQEIRSGDEKNIVLYPILKLSGW
jgi:hypothetical protein